MEYVKEDYGARLDRKLLLSLSVYTPPKEDSEYILSLDEMRALKADILDWERSHPDFTPCYAAEFALLTGMRVGELAALRWSNIRDGYVYVEQAERRFDYADRQGELVVGEPKNGKHRRIPLTPDMQLVLNKVSELGIGSEFVFARKDGKRCPAQAISAAVARSARRAGIGTSSPHEIRRTVSSMLNTVLPQRDVAALLGHTERVNERHYNYSMAQDEEKSRALSRMSGQVIPFPLGDSKEVKSV